MKNLQQIRKRKHITQKEMAKKLHITQATYSGYETQKYSPTIDTLCEISEILESSIDEIVGNIPIDEEISDYKTWLKRNINFKINKLNETNLIHLDGYLTAKLNDQENKEREEYLKHKQNQGK